MKIHIFRRFTWRGYRWYFHARGKNGEIVFASEGYMRRESAVKTVKLIKGEIPHAPVVIEPEDLQGEPT